MIRITDEGALRAAIEKVGVRVYDVHRSIDGKMITASVGDLRTWQLVRSEYARQVAEKVAMKALAREFLTRQKGRQECPASLESR